MDDKTYKTIIDWIFQNHNHHHLLDESDDESYLCDEGNAPFVNSSDLEKFITKIYEEQKKEK